MTYDDLKIGEIYVLESSDFISFYLIKSIDRMENSCDQFRFQRTGEFNLHYFKNDEIRVDETDFLNKLKKIDRRWKKKFITMLFFLSRAWFHDE